MGHTLELIRDTFAVSARAVHPLPLNRILYVASGEIVVTSEGKESRLDGDKGWHSPKACVIVAGPHGAVVLRYQLRRDGESASAATPSAGVASAPLLDHPVDLDPAESYLIRSDRVDFEPGGVALPHRHKGGGIRCLIEGRLDLRVEGNLSRTIEPGQAWFESGREPVYAAADPSMPTSFVRVSILPRAIRGQSSILYVDPADAARGRPRRYTVYVDEPIEI
jgi:quercetin dioxygenase-like cupin family protein